MKSQGNFSNLSCVLNEDIFFARRGETKDDTETKYQTKEQRSIAKKDRAKYLNDVIYRIKIQRRERLLEVPSR